MGGVVPFVRLWQSSSRQNCASDSVLRTSCCSKCCTGANGGVPHTSSFEGPQHLRQWRVLSACTSGRVHRRKCLLSQWRPFQPCAQRQRSWRNSSRQYLPSQWRQLQPSTQRQHLWQSTPRGFGRVRDAGASRVRSTSACDSVQSCFLQCPRRLCNPSRGASANGRVHLASASRVATSCSDSGACARGRARRTSCGCNRSNFAGGGVHLAGLAVSVVPAPTVCTAPAPSLCLPCSWRGHQQCTQSQR